MSFRAVLVAVGLAACGPLEDACDGKTLVFVDDTYILCSTLDRVSVEPSQTAVVEWQVVQDVSATVP